MRFRAILITDKKLEKDQQSFSDHIMPLEIWAAVMIKQYGGAVLIYEKGETLRKTISDQKLE